jgi:RNase P subunit RPR2
MPTIIQLGTLPEEKVHRAICDHCGTVFTFLRKEAKRENSWKNGSFLVIDCPMPGCSKEVHKEI